MSAHLFATRQSLLSLFSLAPASVPRRGAVARRPVWPASDPFQPPPREHILHTVPCIEEEYTLPSVEALMAGTLALLTGYAQSAPGCAHRPLMARKLVSNLCYLSEHPQLSPPMQTMLGNLCTRWQLEVDKEAHLQSAIAPQSLWHAAPEGVQ